MKPDRDKLLTPRVCVQSGYPVDEAGRRKLAAGRPPLTEADLIAALRAVLGLAADASLEELFVAVRELLTRRRKVRPAPQPASPPAPKPATARGGRR